MKKITALFAAFCLFVSIVPISAFATGADAPPTGDAPMPINIASSDFTVQGGTEGADYRFDTTTNILIIMGSGALTIANKNPSTPTTHTIVVQDGTTADITLNGVNIDVSDTTDACAFEIAGSATASITLNGTNTLESGENKAGLQVEARNSQTATLTITSTSMGSLSAMGGAAAAGIGGGNGGSGGNITISGNAQITTAQGGSMGAGIGGGNTGHGGNITISDDAQIITAQGGGNGAGIGGGRTGNGGNITISGNSQITKAQGGMGSAGIGGGFSGSGEIVTISGGNTTVIGDSTGAGIGGGAYGGGADVTITGGTVNVSTSQGSGIGAGDKNTDAGTFTTTATDGSKGNAFIVVTGGYGMHIGYKGEKAQWQGVIFEGNNGLVYGAPTLLSNAEIPAGKTLTMDINKTLTIGAGIALINNGTFINDGTLTGEGTLNGNGTFQTTLLKPEYIVLQNTYEYTGSPINVTPTINGGFTIMDKMFSAVDTGWSFAPEIDNSGTWQPSAVQDIGGYRLRYQKPSMTDVTQTFAVTNDLRPGGDFPYNPIGSLNKGESTLPNGTELKDDGTIIISNTILDKFKTEARNLGMSDEIVYIKDLELVNTADSSDAAPNAETRIRIDVPGLTPAHKAWVLHELADGSIEKYAAECYNEYLLFTPTGFSVYTVVVDWTPSGGSETTTATYNPALSPQTGVYN